MPSTGFAYLNESLAGEPWTPMDDARLLEDRDQGCDVHVMAMRARRTHAEVEKRLAELANDHPLRSRKMQGMRSFRR